MSTADHNANHFWSRLPRHNNVVKREPTPLREYNPLLSPRQNAGRVLVIDNTNNTAKAEDNDMARIIRDLEITKIAATNTTNASTSTIMKADAAMPTHQQTLDRLEAEVARLEARVTKELKTSYSADEDWDDDGDNSDDVDNNSDDDDEEDDDTDDTDVQKLGRHRFEALTDWVATRDGVNHATAAERARKEYPKTYASYQRSDNGDDVGKSYRELVNAEIRKGCSPTVAAQRVAYAHPQAAAQAQHDAINKGVSQFMHEVDKEMQRDGCSRTQAMEKVRRARPDLFRKYQNV